MTQTSFKCPKDCEFLTDNNTCLAECPYDLLTIGRIDKKARL